MDKTGIINVGIGFWPRGTLGLPYGSHHRCPRSPCDGNAATRKRAGNLKRSHASCLGFNRVIRKVLQT